MSVVLFSNNDWFWVKASSQVLARSPTFPDTLENAVQTDAAPTSMSSPAGVEPAPHPNRDCIAVAT